MVHQVAIESLFLKFPALAHIILAHTTRHDLTNKNLKFSKINLDTFLWGSSEPKSLIYWRLIFWHSTVPIFASRRSLEALNQVVIFFMNYAYW